MQRSAHSTMTNFESTGSEQTSYFTALQWQRARYFASNDLSSADAKIASNSLILTSRSALKSWKSVAHAHLNPFSKHTPRLERSPNMYSLGNKLRVLRDGDPPRDKNFRFRFVFEVKVDELTNSG